MKPRTARKLAVWTRIVTRLRRWISSLVWWTTRACEHRDLVEERLDVLEDHAGLLPVGGEHHHDAPLARREDGAVVA